MEYIKELLSVPASVWVSVITVVLLIIGGATWLKGVAEEWGLETKTSKKFKQQEKEIEELREAVKDIHEVIKQFRENRVHDREQSKKIQEDLIKDIGSVDGQLSEFIAAFKQQEIQNKKRVRAELKDRIGQSYRYHNQTKQWTSMDKEALQDLISEYEAADGKNSFVHSVVQKEMYTWNLTDEKEESV